MHWDGRRWERELTLRAFDLARAVCREAGEGLENAKLRARILSAGTRAAVENLARSDRAHAAVPEQWDADPWVLNTPGGIVDLETATILPHDPLAYHTKITAVAPGGDCPLWRDFLARITDSDDDLQAYLQRSAGYALTGSIREHVLQFGYGTGANGKGTYLNSLAGIMGDYACTAPMETFAATSGERHPTDLAMLRGARLVTAQETEQGRRWAEAKIKALTGGDPISARFMRQDFFTFKPQFKLFIAGNHRPGLSGVDEAIRRRMHLVPFNVTIPEEDRDLELPAQGRVARHPRLDARGLHGLAGGRTQPARVCARRDREVPRRRGHFRALAGRLHHGRPERLGKQRRPLALVEALGRDRRRVRRDSETVQPDPRGTRFHRSQRRHEGKPARLSRRPPHPYGLHRGPALWGLTDTRFGRIGRVLPFPAYGRARARADA